ncbi:hypothetical protein Tco_0422812, partial [Tanacetum coccineum]
MSLGNNNLFCDVLHGLLSHGERDQISGSNNTARISFKALLKFERFFFDRVLASAQRNSSKVGHGLLSRCIWIISPKNLYFAGGEYPGSNGLDGEDNKGYCFIDEFAVSERCNMLELSSNYVISKWHMGANRIAAQVIKPHSQKVDRDMLKENKSITTQDLHGSGVNTICTTDSHQLDLDK